MSTITYGQLHAVYVAEVRRLAADASRINDSMPAELRTQYPYLVAAAMERRAFAFLCDEAEQRLSDADYAALAEAVEIPIADSVAWGERAARELGRLCLAADRAVTAQADL